MKPIKLTEEQLDACFGHPSVWAWRDEQGHGLVTFPTWEAAARELLRDCARQAREGIKPGMLDYRTVVITQLRKGGN